MAIERRLMTAAELAALPDTGRPQMLIEGALITMTPPNWTHGRVTSRVDRRLGQFVEQHGLGEVLVGDSGVLLERDPDTVLGADVCFIAHDRLPPRPWPDGFPAIVPDLVVEVRSPNDRAGQVREKTRRWLAAGVQVVWNVDPKTETIEVCRSGVAPHVLHAGDTLDAEPVLPGFAVPVRDLFA